MCKVSRGLWADLEKLCMPCYGVYTVSHYEVGDGEQTSDVIVFFLEIELVRTEERWPIDIISSAVSAREG